MKNNTVAYKHPDTVWENIKQDIELMIIKGDLKNADRVPSISELSNNYSIGKSTAKKVLENLYQENTITKQRGVGYFVKPYTKEKLKEKHQERIVAALDSCILSAKELGIKENELQEIVVSRVKSIYSR